MKKILSIIIIVFILLLLPKNTIAKTKITLTNEITGITNPTNLKISYLIKPASENKDNVIKEPTELEVDFSDVLVTNYKLVKEVDIDFSNVEYPESGIYRYIIKQNKLSDSINFNKSKQVFFIYVNVVKNEDTTEINVSDLVYETESQEKTSLIFQNDVNYTYFEIENRTEGKLKEQDKNVYFKYKVEINGTPNHIYNIVGQDPYINYHGETIKTTDYYIVKENKEENYVYIYLKDNQRISIGKYIETRIVTNNGLTIPPDDENNTPENNNIEETITINQIPLDTELTIKKIGDEKWLTIIDGKETITKTVKAKEKDNYILIINTRDFDNAITGVFYKQTPYAIIVLSLFILYMVIKRIKVKEEDKYE